MKRTRPFFILLMWQLAIACQNTPASQEIVPNGSREPQSLFQTFEENYLKRIFIKQKHYKIVKDISQELLQRCPTEDCVLVGVGRSPTPLIAFVDNLIPNKMLQLPLSNFRFNTEGEKEIVPELLDRISEVDHEYKYKLTPELEEKLFIHFQNFMDHYQLEGKKIVLTDISNQSILSVYKYFKKFLVVTESKSQLEVVQIIDSHFEPMMELVKKLYNVSAPRIKINDFSMSYIFKVEAYDKYSPYGHYDIVKDDELHIFKRRPFKSFIKLKKAINFRMQQDTNLYSDFKFLDFPTLSCLAQIKMLL